jgi:CRP/FNR family cyclic AMP-dependent transcriptional regulator
MDTIEFLIGCDFFKGLSEDELQQLSGVTKTRRVGKNTLVINEDDISSSMYFIVEGRVNATLSNEDGKEVILSSLHKGDHFGELSLLDGEPRSTNIITTEPCVFLVVHKDDFYCLLEKNSKIAINVIKYLCGQVRHITKNVESLALMDVYGRLVRLLHDLSEPSESGKLVVQQPLTHKDIALRVGSSREMISRILKELEKGDYLIIENKVITINKKLPLAW